MKRLSITQLRESYKSQGIQVRQWISSLREEIEKDKTNERIFIHFLSSEELEPILKRLEDLDPSSLPLYGVPFVIKDNIDLEGIPTTAACEAYAYIPKESAFVVELLIQAGAVPLGKVNLDQFATGLVGVRSPYGVPENPVSPGYIPGGSSSGSAVAVAKGYAAFSLGTDTAGSGRVPAAYNELIGLKPTRGVLSNRGLVPACKSLDCISIFANSPEDAKLVFDQVNVYDEEDVFSRDYLGSESIIPEKVVVGVPKTEQLCFFGNDAFQIKFGEFIETLKEQSYVEVKSIDFKPFLDAAKLLYEGSWVVERYAAVGEFIKNNPGSAHPVTESIIRSAEKIDAKSVFEDSYRLQVLKKLADKVLDDLDAVVSPTVGTHYKVEEVLADPVQSNTNLGYYTNFMNLLDLSAIACPAGRTTGNLPFGVTFFAKAHTDDALMQLVSRLSGAEINCGLSEEYMDIAVCGAHMDGLALNHQLIDLGATFVETSQTSSNYQLHCLHHKDPIRPGMVRVSEGGSSIDFEIWRLPKVNVGAFLSLIQEPLGLGSIERIDGNWIKGFICEGRAVEMESTEDITSLGSWREFLSTLKK